MQRIVILSNNGRLSVEDIPNYITKNYVVKNDIKEINYESDNHDFNEVVKNLEIKLITDAMIKSKGNKSEAAKYLNVNRSTLYYKLDLYDLKELEQ